MSEGRVWFYILNGGSNGPVTEAELLGFLDSGTVERGTLVWRDGVPDWISLASALGLAERAPPPIPSHTSNPPSEVVETPKKATRNSTSSDFSDSDRHPWRRFLARIFDLTVHGALVFFLIGLLLISINQDLGKAYVDFISQHGNIASLICIAVVTLPNALFVGFSGVTVGKWLFGIKVVDASSGMPVGFGRALQRELRVYWSAWGLGLPIVYLFTLYHAFKDLKKNGINSWDGELGSVLIQRPNGENQYVLSVVAVVLWIGIFATLVYIDHE